VRESLCYVSIECETIFGIIIWCPIPGEIVTVPALKAASIECQKFCDLCTVDLSSSLC